MKKKVLIVVCILFVLIIVGALILAFVRGNKNIATKTEQLEKKVISINSYDDFDELVGDEGLNVFYSEDETVANAVDFDFWNSTSEMTIFFDAEKNIESFNIYVPLCNISELSTENSGGKIEDQVYDVCRETINNFSKLFGLQYTENIQLTNYDGTFCVVESMDDITGLLNEESYINFAVRDKNGHYYILRISLFESTLEVEIIKYFDVDEYKDYIANISLYEEKEN